MGIILNTEYICIPTIPLKDIKRAQSKKKIIGLCIFQVASSTTVHWEYILDIFSPAILSADRHRGLYCTLGWNIVINAALLSGHPAVGRVEYTLAFFLHRQAMSLQPASQNVGSATTGSTAYFNIPIFKQTANRLRRLLLYDVRRFPWPVAKHTVCVCVCEPRRLCMHICLQPHSVYCILYTYILYV